MPAHPSDHDRPSAPASGQDHAAHTAHAAHLRLDGISHSYGAHRVLTDVSLTASAGDSTALIGENGSGKSTLLRIAAGILEPDSGEVSITAPGSASPRVGLLHQEPPFAENATIDEALAEAVAPVRAAAHAVDEAAARLAEHPDEEHSARTYAAALETAERLDVWTLDARIGEMLSGLGLASLPRDRPTGRLSGGQRARLSLAWVLLSSSDALLLDEPTNHLDDTATAHLVSVIRAWRGPVLLTSHDRAFLDDAATVLVDLDPSSLPHRLTGPLLQDGAGTGIGVTSFRGRFSEYLEERRAARERWEVQFRDEQEELARLRAAVRENQTVGHEGAAPRTEGRAAKRFYADRNAAVVSRRVRDARGRLEELERAQIRKPPRELAFRGWEVSGTPQRSGGSGSLVLQVRDAAVDGRLAPVSMQVEEGSRWLITGANGSGKSTLLSAIAGLAPLSSGSITMPQRITGGMLTQDPHLPDPAQRGLARSVAQAYYDLVGAELAEKMPLASFGLIAPRDEGRAVGDLSTGQRRRLELAVLLADPPDLLLLDEPTNHLALRLVTELEGALPAYPGTVLIASHDRWLRERWEGGRVELEAAAPDGA